ncbi:MAG TPA: hypothetical protein VFJ14_11040 [Nocardioidaceae bacterium]|nr:hypothetical protein [Nocardioidaceae bacterium]
MRWNLSHARAAGGASVARLPSRHGVATTAGRGCLNLREKADEKAGPRDKNERQKYGAGAGSDDGHRGRAGVADRLTR